MHIADVKNTIITHDAGSPRDELSPFWKSTTPLSYIGWGKSTQLGYGLGLAMGAKVAQPDKLCINMWGDAAIGMTGMDFETCARAKIPIMSILFNNFAMAMEDRQMATSRRRSTTPPTSPATTPSSARRWVATPSGSPTRARWRMRWSMASTPPRKASRCCWNSSPPATRSVPSRVGGGGYGNQAPGSGSPPPSRRPPRRSGLSHPPARGFEFPGRNG